MFRPQKPHVPQPELRWKYLPIRAGEKHTLYVAGEPIGVWLHWVGNSKPCVSEMTGGKVSCPFDHEVQKPIWRAYLPCYTPIKEQVVILYTLDYHELVEGLDLFAAISARRGKGGRDPVVIKAVREGVPPLSFRNQPPASADIRKWLLLLWGDKALTQALEKEDAKRPEELKEQNNKLRGKRASSATQAKPDEQEAKKVRDILRTRMLGGGEQPNGTAAPEPEPPVGNGKHR